MTTEPPLLPPIGILAGHGSLPVEIARAITQRGRRVQIVAIDAAISPELRAFPYAGLGLGQVGAILKAFHSAGCKEIVIVGGTSRPDLNSLRPDLGLIANLVDVARLVFSGGDDGMLRLVVRFFEQKGFTVVSPAVVAPHLVVGAGCLTRDEPTASDIADILLGSSVVRALGAFDVGQAVIVSAGELVAVEAAEGTDQMLVRVAAIRQRAAGLGAPMHPARGVLIKRPKPGQELRVDLPAIGPDTVSRAADAYLAGIAVLAGQALAADRPELAARAAKHTIFVYGFTEGIDNSTQPSSTRWLTAQPLVLGTRRPSSAQLADVRRTACALGSLAALTRGGAAVVSRGHILGIETGGAITELFSRALRNKQWGEGRWRWRTGVGVLAPDTALTSAIIKAAQDAHFAGIVVMGSSATRAPAVSPHLVRQANAAGLFLIQLRSAELGS